MSRGIVEIFTDGACLGNPGPGGYAALLRYKENTKSLSRGFYRTTNNRMELMGAIAGLEALSKERPFPVCLYSDSRYLCQGMQTWLNRWKANGWRSGTRAAVVNRDLWERLDHLSDHFQIQWHLIKGHSGHPENEYCDKLAKSAARSPIEIDTGYERVSVNCQPE